MWPAEFGWIIFNPVLDLLVQLFVYFTLWDVLFKKSNDNLI